MQPIILAALVGAVGVIIYQARRAAVLAADHSWGINSQGAWHWRRPWAALFARLLPVDLVHFDVDRLKQHGDECIAVVPAGEGVVLAYGLLRRLAALPLAADERAALGGPISATLVVVRTVRDVAAAERLAVTAREALKRDDRRATVQVIDGDE